ALVGAEGGRARIVGRGGGAAVFLRAQRRHVLGILGRKLGHLLGAVDQLPQRGVVELVAVGLAVPVAERDLDRNLRVLRLAGRGDFVDREASVAGGLARQLG